MHKYTIQAFLVSLIVSTTRFAAKEDDPELGVQGDLQVSMAPATEQEALAHQAATGQSIIVIPQGEEPRCGASKAWDYALGFLFTAEVIAGLIFLQGVQCRVFLSKVYGF